MALLLPLRSSREAAVGARSWRGRTREGGRETLGLEEDVDGRGVVPLGIAEKGQSTESNCTPSKDIRFFLVFVV